MTHLFYLLPLTLFLGACSPRTKVVELERVRTEYQERLHLQRDSIYLHDSVFVERSGDTIYKERWHTRYREILRHDTAFVERRDSIAYPVIVEVEKPTSWLHKLELNAYRLVLLLLLIYFGWHTIRRYLWRRRL